jgi:hypothetical protein
MATRRFTGTGRFEDREGNVLVVTSITAEIEPVAVGVGGSSCLSSPQQPEREGGVGETPDALFEDGASPRPPGDAGAPRRTRRTP